MKAFVTGVCGQLGFDVMNELKKRGHIAIGSDICENSSFEKYLKLDIVDEKEVEKVICEIKPDVIIHCAAWTAVDAAEEQENVDNVYKINGTGTANIAKSAKLVDAKMVYISTDYVFDGSGDAPWMEDDRRFAPLNVYGKSKLIGELAVSELLEKYFVVRIAWVFGLNGKNFIKTMLDLGKKYDTIQVVADQVGTPTYTFDLARLLIDFAESEKYGFYHVTNEGGYISWYDFACEIFKLSGYSVKVLPVTTKEYGISKAARPFNSRLNKSKLLDNGFEALPTWQDALSRYLKEIKRL